MGKNGQIINVGVIGLGMGRGHLDSYHKNPRARAVAICDAHPERLAKAAAEFNIPAENCFADCRRILSAAGRLGLEAVSVALPNHLHAPVTIAALKAGLHVLCEKPMALNVVQARAMLRASQRAGRRLMINFSYKFSEQAQALKRLVDSGAIGDIYFGRTAWHRRRGLPGMGAWFGIKQHSGGGPLIDLGVHRLHMALWLMGYPRPVSVSGSVHNAIACRLAKHEGKCYDVEDLGAAFIRFANGAALVLEASWAGFSEKKEEMVTQLYGTKGGILQRNVGEDYEFEARAYSEQAGTLWESRIQQTLTPVKSAYSEFIDSILDDRPCPAPAEHGLAVQILLDAIYRSAATGREVRIPQSAG